jgi:multicomponent Na+:H+ antiporter subunit C
MIYGLALVLLFVGLYGVLSKKNIVKIIISLTIMEYAVNLFLILLGYSAVAVDPLPQALVLVSMVMALGLLVLMVSLCTRLYERYGTLDITKIRKLKG